MRKNYLLIIIMIFLLSIIIIKREDCIRKKEISLADTYLIGDVNGDGKVSSADYILVKKHILGLSLLNSSNEINADANYDNKISSSDYMIIKKAILYNTTISKPQETPSATVDVESIVLNKTNISLSIGATETLIATVSPSNASNKTVTWSSSNPKIATVDASGVVSAKSEGTATITAATSNGKTATCSVTVKAGWVENMGSKEYYDSNLQKYTDKWLQEGSDWYYFDSGGAMKKDSILFDSRKSCWVRFGSDGKMYRDKWYKSTYNWSYYGSDGCEYRSRWLQYNGYKYYFKSTGGAWRDVTTTIDGKQYTFDSEARCTKGC